MAGARPHTLRPASTPAQRHGGRRVGLLESGLTPVGTVTAHNSGQRRRRGCGQTGALWATARPPGALPKSVWEPGCRGAGGPGRQPPKSMQASHLWQAQRRLEMGKKPMRSGCQRPHPGGRTSPPWSREGLLIKNEALSGVPERVPLVPPTPQPAPEGRHSLTGCSRPQTRSPQARDWVCAGMAPGEGPGSGTATQWNWTRRRASLWF